MAKSIINYVKITVAIAAVLITQYSKIHRFLPNYRDAAEFEKLSPDQKELVVTLKSENRLSETEIKRNISLLNDILSISNSLKNDSTFIENYISGKFIDVNPVARRPEHVLEDMKHNVVELKVKISGLSTFNDDRTKLEKAAINMEKFVIEKEPVIKKLCDDKINSRRY